MYIFYLSPASSRTEAGTFEYLSEFRKAPFEQVMNASFNHRLEVPVHTFIHYIVIHLSQYLNRQCKQ